MNLSTEINEDDSLAVVNITGVFDYTCYDGFSEVLELDEKYDGKLTKYILDFSATDYMDSSALGMLLMLREVAGKRGGDVVIRGCNDSLLGILKIANFDKIFKVIGL